MAGERTEKATPQKRRKAVEKGDRPRSRDLTSATATLAGIFTLGSVASLWITHWHSSFERSMELGLHGQWSGQEMTKSLSEMRGIMLTFLTPLFFVLAVTMTSALAMSMVQSGGLSVHGNSIAFKFARLNPAENFKHTFSLRAVSRLVKSMLPAAVLAWIAIGRLRESAGERPLGLARLARLPGDLYALLIWAGIVLFLWAGIDYLMEHRAWNKRLKMSKQDIRDEHKDSEGNPQIKSRIKGLQRQIRRRRLKAEVARAAVVITNPTHYAVALSFDFETMDAPRVLAKGRDLLAEEIKREARWAGVPILENPPLARSLYRTVEEGQSIPADLYAAVAAILAFLYRRQVEERKREMKTNKEKTQAYPPSIRPRSEQIQPRSVDIVAGRLSDPGLNKSV